MRARVTKIGEVQDSKHGGKYVPLYFKSLDDGKSYRTCIYLICRNWHDWAFILQPGYNLNTILDGLVIKDDHLLDADFPPRIAKPEPFFDAPIEITQPEIPFNYAEGKKHVAEMRQVLAGVR